MSLRDEWGRVSEAFAAALERSSAERAQWLEECVEPDVRESVRALLEADARPTGVLDRGVADLTSAALVRGPSTPAGPTPAPGDHVGPYRILREAGRGGMGVVYQAYDARLRRFVAVKVLTGRFGGGAAGLADRSLTEARAAAALDHPNICTVYDVGQTTDGDHYIAMAYYPGQTLAQRLSHGPLSAHEAVHIARQILAGLGTAHEHGIVHRDIKPSNVLLTSRNEVKILDFGVATIRRHDPMSRLPARIGTPRYMAPEQFLGQVADRRADLWAVGVLLHEMVTGSHPFRGATVAELSDAIVLGRPAPLGARGSFQGLDEVIHRVLEKDPAARYPDAGAFKAALDGMLPGGRLETKASNTLPAPVTSFLGREAEVREVVAALESVRLVTLTGPGGAGKTRLSLEVARRVVERYLDGVRFVSLGAVRESAQVPHVVLQHLGVSEPSMSSPEERAALALEDAELLLVLDNFEHVSAAATFVAQLLGRCPKLRVLVTSRGALRIHGEQEWAVPPLAPPVSSDASVAILARNPAVALFVARAQAIRPSFRLTEANAGTVVDLCRSLDGLPLAIELAAAQIKLFTPEAIRSRLERHMDVLKSRRLDAPARHHTLSGAMAWSYDLLSADARRLFERMSVFDAGGSLEAVESAASAGPIRVPDVLGELATLVDQSLVRQEEVEDEPRFDMLQTIRAFAVGKFEAADERERRAVRMAHAGFFLGLAEAAEPNLVGSEQASWLDRLERERGNLRTAIEGAIEMGEPEVALRIAAAAWRLWLVRGPLAEGRILLDRVIGLSSDVEVGTVSTRARALAGVGTLAHNEGDNQRARERLQESLRLWRAIDDRSGVASALTDLAWVHCELSELEPARTLSTEALALHRAAGERRGVARALNNLGWIANYRAEYRQARAYLEEGLEIRRDIGDERGVAFVLASLAWAEQYHGDHERSERLLTEAMQILERVNDPVLLTYNRLMMALLAEHRGQLARSRGALEELLPLAVRSGNGSLLAWTNTALGRVALGLGDRETAVRALETARERWRAIDCPWGLATALLPSAVLWMDDDGVEPAAAIEQAVDIFEEIGDSRGLADAWDTLARVVAARDPRRARALSTRASELRRDRGLAAAPGPR